LTLYLSTTAVVSIASYRALTIVYLRASSSFLLCWLTCSWRLFTISSVNWLRNRPPGWLLSFHLLVLRLRAGIRRFKVLQICILSWARRIVITSLIWVVMWIVQNYIWRKAFDNPFVLESFIGCQTLLWIPLQASTYEIDKWIIWCFSEFLHDVL
jgi:hypothetical protein